MGTKATPVVRLNPVPQRHLIIYNLIATSILYFLLYSVCFIVFIKGTNIKFVFIQKKFVFIQINYHDNVNILHTLTMIMSIYYTR